MKISLTKFIETDYNMYNVFLFWRAVNYYFLVQLLTITYAL